MGHHTILAPFGWTLACSHAGDLMPPVMAGHWVNFTVVVLDGDAAENRHARAERPLFECQDWG